MLTAGWVLCSLTVLVLLQVRAGMAPSTSQPDSSLHFQHSYQDTSQRQELPNQRQQMLSKAQKAFGLY